MKYQNDGERRRKLRLHEWNLGLISTLCEIIRLQNELVEKQEEIIKQADVCEAAAVDLRTLRKDADDLKGRLDL